MKAESYRGAVVVAVTALTLAAFAGALSACKGQENKPGESFAAQPPPPPSAPANGSHLKDEEVLTFVDPQKLPVYTGPTGSIEGTITITGDPPPDVPGLDFKKCPLAKDAYTKLFRTGATQSNGAKTLADALVAVTGYGALFLPERNPVRTATFENCALDGRTIDMTIGQRLEVTSKDEALFAPILAQAQLPALMLASKNTAPVELYPPKPGYYTLVDRMELSYLRADVYVLLQPLHVVTGLDGHYRIDGIPVGKATVNTRLARLRKETSKEITVDANTVQTVDLSIDFNAATDVPKEPIIRPSSMPIP
jgi:hypothetical protein